MNSSQETRIGLVKLDYLTLIAVSGADAEHFLQGQFSNDVVAIEGQNGQLNAYCTPKGRALSIFQLFRKDNQFWMLVPSDITDSLIKRLRMYLMRAKVVFDVLPKDHYLTGIGAPSDQELIENAAYAPDSTILYPKGQTDRFIVINENTEQLDQASILQSSELQSDEPWKRIDIESGIPQVYTSTLESFIPQNVNLDMIDGVNFRKGCYPGQEIVARLKYLGKSKQRMTIGEIYLGQHQDKLSIAPGTELFTSDRPDQKAGVIVDAVEISENNFKVTAIIPAKLIGITSDAATLFVGNISGPTLNQSTMPYSISE